LEIEPVARHAVPGHPTYTDGVNPVLLRLWLSRIIGLLLIVKVVDNLVRVGYEIRLLRAFQLHRSTTDNVLAGISVTILSYLALTLWFRPNSIFPLTQTKVDPTLPPATMRDWGNLVGTAFGLYLVCTGLQEMALSFMSHSPVRLPPTPGEAAVHIVAGLVVFVFANISARLWFKRVTGSVWKAVDTSFIYHPDADEDQLADIAPAPDAPPAEEPGSPR
jgi:hypothetical protein